MLSLHRISTYFLKAPRLNIAIIRACAGVGRVSTSKEEKFNLSETCNCIVPLSNRFSIRSLSSKVGTKDWSSSDSTSDLSSHDVPKTDSLMRSATPGLFKLILEERSSSLSGALDKYIEGKELSRSEVYQVLFNLRTRKLFKKALQLSEWIKRRDDFYFLERDYASMLDLIAKVYGHQKAESYINDIPKSFRGEVVYRTLLANFVSETHVNKSVQLFSKMKELGFPLTTFTCDQMLLLYKRTDKRKTEDMLLMMERENIKPSVFTYQVLIDTKGRLNDIRGMERVVDQMISKGLEPTVRMQAILANHYTVAGLTEKAEAVLKNMESNDLKTISFIRSLVLPIYADLGKAEEVGRIWKSIESRPQQAESLAAIAAFGKLKNVKQAETVFNEMAKSYTKLNSRHYTSMLKVYAENKMLDKVKELLKQMRDDGCYIGQVAWDVLVKLYVDVGEVETADSMLLNATQQNQSFTPMFSSYMAILHAYSIRGNVPNAEKIFRRMKQDDYAARAQPFRALLQTYINAKVPAYGIRERMKANNIYPNKVLSEQLALVEPFSQTSVSSELRD